MQFSICVHLELPENFSNLIDSSKHSLNDDHIFSNLFEVASKTSEFCKKSLDIATLNDEKRIVLAGFALPVLFREMVMQMIEAGSETIFLIDTLRLNQIQSFETTRYWQKTLLIARQQNVLITDCNRLPSILMCHPIPTAIVFTTFGDIKNQMNQWVNSIEWLDKEKMVRLVWDDLKT